MGLGNLRCAHRKGCVVALLDLRGTSMSFQPCNQFDGGVSFLEGSLKSIRSSMFNRRVVQKGVVAEECEGRRSGKSTSSASREQDKVTSARKIPNYEMNLVKTFNCQKGASEFCKLTGCSSLRGNQENGSSLTRQGLLMSLGPRLPKLGKSRRSLLKCRQPVRRRP